MNKSLLIGGAAIILIVLVFIFARPSGNSPANVANNLTPNALAAETQNYDFGTVSMAAGNVSYATTIKNTSAAPVTITRLYTSCMCTTGTLEVGNKKLGPFGMPGHGGAGIVNTNEALAPGEEATLKITFDPAAHGPAGVGFIERVITVETNAGAPLELAFTATVTP